MRYGLCLLLLSSLSSCHQTDSANSQQSATQVNPLLGHWQCDSVASTSIDSMGRAQGEPHLEGANFALDVTPTQFAITVSTLPGDTAIATYTQRGQELLTTAARKNHGSSDLNSEVEHAQIIALTPTVFRMEKTFPSLTRPFRVRYFYHR